MVALRDSVPPLLPGLGSVAFHLNPEPWYQQMHADSGVRIYTHPLSDGLVVTGYDDLFAVLTHREMQAQDRTTRTAGPTDKGAMRALFDAHPVFMNEPLHRGVRNATLATIGIKRKKWAIKQIESVCDEVLDDLQGLDEFDLVSEFACQISSRVWARFLGFPDSVAVDLLKISKALSLPLKLSPQQSDLQQADSAADELIRLYDAFRNTQASESLDIMYQELGNRDAEDQSHAAWKVLLSLTFDAIDGAAGLLSNVLHQLCINPTLQELVRAEPDLIEPLWNETARFNPPLLGLFRSPITDVDFDGFTVRAGQNVLTLNAAGNRDPRRYEDPDRFNLYRTENRALSFGMGVRGCSGRYLASLQGQICLAKILERFTRISLVSQDMQWGEPSLLRVVQSLPVLIDR